MGGGGGGSERVSFPLISTVPWLPLDTVQVLVGVVVVVAVGGVGVIPGVVQGEGGPHVLQDGEVCVAGVW